MVRLPSLRRSLSQLCSAYLVPCSHDGSRYSYWKTVFPENVLALKGVQAGFRRGLDLMNQAMSLGSAAASQLPRPSLTAPAPTSPRSSQRANGNGTKPHARRSDRKEDDEITFRSLAETFVTERDLIWAPTGRSDLNTGQVLFRISRDGRTGGVVGYVSEDAFYLLEGGGLDGAPSAGKPVSLDEVVRRAQGGK
jgi:tuftelin-interacting protein 11